MMMVLTLVDVRLTIQKGTLGQDGWLDVFIRVTRRSVVECHFYIQQYLLKLSPTQQTVSNTLVKSSLDESYYSLELPSPPRCTTQIELSLNPLVGEEILEFLVLHHLLNPLGDTNKGSSVVGVHFLWSPASGDEALETRKEFFSFQVGNRSKNRAGVRLQAYSNTYAFPSVFAFLRYFKGPA